MGVIRNADLPGMRDGGSVTIAGLVLVRQRPGSAKGVIFMTLEDETGVANAIVWKKVFDKYRSVVMTARLAKIHGRLQSQSGVIHVVVDHIEDITPLLELLQRQEAYPGSCRCNEAVESDGPRRQEFPHDTRPETVMPRGRNFH